MTFRPHIPGMCKDLHMDPSPIFQTLKNLEGSICGGALQGVVQCDWSDMTTDPVSMISAKRVYV